MPQRKGLKTGEDQRIGAPRGRGVSHIKGMCPRMRTREGQADGTQPPMRTQQSQAQYAPPLLMIPTGFPVSFRPPNGEFLDFDLNAWTSTIHSAAGSNIVKFAG